VEHQIGLPVAGFIRELMFIRDGRLIISNNNVSFTRKEIETFIEQCTNYVFISN